MDHASYPPRVTLHVLISPRTLSAPPVWHRNYVFSLECEALTYPYFKYKQLGQKQKTGPVLPFYDNCKEWRDKTNDLDLNAWDFSERTAVQIQAYDRLCRVYAEEAPVTLKVRSGADWAEVRGMTMARIPMPAAAPPSPSALLASSGSGSGSGSGGGGGGKRGGKTGGGRAMGEEEE
jgi:hypothetical protein